MTALQDWLSFRPGDEGMRDGLRDGLKDMMFRPLRAVLSVVEDFDDAVDGALERFTAHTGPQCEAPVVPDYLPDNVILMRPGLERC